MWCLGSCKARALAGRGAFAAKDFPVIFYDIVAHVDVLAVLVLGTSLGTKVLGRGSTS